MDNAHDMGGEQQGGGDRPLRTAAAWHYDGRMTTPGENPYDLDPAAPPRRASVAAPPISTAPPPVQSQPACWKCGYNLSGVFVDGVCPECGTPIWSVPPAAADSTRATTAMVLGIVGLVLCLTCIGPLALGMAIPAIIIGRKASVEAVALQGRNTNAGSAKAGVICGWITVVLSLGLLVLYGVMIALGVLA